jgi:hypothetical protein
MADIQERATGLLGQIPFGAIIGGPLIAAVEAQSASAVACYNFIRDVGFEDAPRISDDTAAKKEGGGAVAVGADGNPAPKAKALNTSAAKVRTIEFYFERKEPNPDDKTKEVLTRTTITVPLLTVMPLPFIRIESMTVNFKASIGASDTSSLSNSSSTGADAKLEASAGFALWKASLSGTVSSKKDSTATNTSKYSVEHTIDVSVHAVQDDMPAGLARILSMMTNAIGVTSAPVK